MPKSEVEHHANFDKIRYANVWEDAHVLVSALGMRPGGTYLSIASAGDNALAMLAQDPERVYAVDLSAAQTACTELKAAAYGLLELEELYFFLGLEAKRQSSRTLLFKRIEPYLSAEAQEFFASNPDLVARGIVQTGKFENYFRLFRRLILPLVHSPASINELQRSKSYIERAQFYYRTWDNFRWRSLFKLYFSRNVMGTLGRDKAFFRYVDEDVASSILKRVEYALIELDPSENPYLHFILHGTFGRAKPPYLLAENQEAIRRNLSRLSVHTASLESFLDDCIHQGLRFDGFNISDVFEYMSVSVGENLYRRLLQCSNPGARLVYWNMMAPRSRPECFSDCVIQRRDLAQPLLRANRTFFYRDLHIDEVL